MITFVVGSGGVYGQTERETEREKEIKREKERERERERELGERHTKLHALFQFPSRILEMSDTNQVKHKSHAWLFLLDGWSEYKAHVPSKNLISDFFFCSNQMKDKITFFPLKVQIEL